MDIQNLSQKLINDIDFAYDDAIKMRVSSIQSQINDIIAYFKSKNLSLFGIANLDAISDFNQITTSQNFPSLIKIGYNKHIRNGNVSVNIPSIMDLTSSKGICIESNKVTSTEVHTLLQNIALRIILSLPDNLVKLNIFDAASNGANFNYILALDKAKSNLFTSESEISIKLNEIVSSFTALQTNTLSFKYHTIEEYNLLNDKKVPYQILLISNFPEGFGYRMRESITALKKIIENGHKYGTLVLMSHDMELFSKNSYQNLNEIEGFIAKLKKTSAGNFKLEYCDETNNFDTNYKLQIDDQLPANKVKIIDFLNDRYKTQNKQFDSFTEYYNSIISKNEVWTSNTNNLINFTIGFKNGHREPKGFHLGQKDTITNHHCLIGGRTGSGKSVLINNIIINACYNYSPEELQFYVIDLKGGEYPDFYDLPHIKVLFQDAEKVDIALNVLESVQNEYFKRVKDFKIQKTNEISVYKSSNKLPRVVLIIDEFQTFNQSDNHEIKTKSKDILEFLITKGRSYGIHVLLASQHLANANLSQAALSNIQVRLVLPLAADGCGYILSRENIEPEKLQNLELIYNDQLGYKPENNVKFNIPFLKGNLIKPHTDFLKEKFRKSKITDFKRYFMPREENVSIEEKLSDSIITKSSEDENIYLGSPYFIKEDDSYIRLEKEIENNILILGQDAPTSYRLLFLIMSQFICKHPANQIVYLQYTPKTSRFSNIFSELSTFYKNFNHQNPSNVDEVLKMIENEILVRRSKDDIENELLFVIPQINTDTSFNVRNNSTISRIKAILENGPILGIYTIIYIESYNSFYELSNFVNLCKFKIATKGGGSSQIVNKKEVDEDGFVYLVAPDPFAVMNPDLIRVFNSYSPTFFSQLNTTIKIILNKLFIEF